jgi:hypothetical protein
VNFNATGATTAAGALWALGTSLTTNVLPVDGSEVQMLMSALTTTAFKTGDGTTPAAITVSAPTTVFLVAEATFTAGTVAAYGTVSARRMR